MEYQNEALQFVPRTISLNQLYVRRALVLLLPASLFSIFIYFFIGLSFIHTYASYCFSTFVYPLVTPTLERKYMFLICNGILVFLACKSSFSYSTSSDVKFENQAKAHDDVQDKLQPTDSSAVVSKEESSTCDEDGRDHGARHDHNRVEEGGDVEMDIIAEEDDQDLQLDGHESENEGGGPGGYMMLEGDGENDDTESEGPPSNTEELNRKIEEFIRKMKEELRLQAQQQQLIIAT